MYQKMKWSDILTIISGKNQKGVASEDGEYYIYGSGGIIGRANDYLCPANTVIVGRKGTINHPLYVTEPFWNIDTAFGVVAGEELLPKFLYYFCLQFNFKELDKSTGRPSVSKADLLKIEMPIPNIEEQARIVSRIEELFSELDKGVETLQVIKEQLAVYRQAVLKMVFASMNERKSIQEVSSLVTSGSRGWAKYYNEKGVRFIRITDLTRDKIKLKNNAIQRVLLPEGVEGKRSRLQGNDVLISITADLGSIALVPEDVEEAYINQHIAVVRFVNSHQGEFMAWYLKSDYGQKELLRNKRGGGKLGLGLDDIRNTLVPIVSDEVADEVVSEIESRMSVCDSIEQIVGTALSQAEAMRQSILKKAFEGGLN